jgi:hypothetical protein
MEMRASGKLSKMARDTLVFPLPEPPVTPIIIGLLVIIFSYFLLHLYYHKTWYNKR